MCLHNRNLVCAARTFYRWDVFLDRDCLCLIGFGSAHWAKIMWYFRSGHKSRRPTDMLKLVHVLWHWLVNCPALIGELSICVQVPRVHREFSMGVASIADSAGIVLAGVASIFIHSYVCHLPTWLAVHRENFWLSIFNFFVYTTWIFQIAIHNNLTVSMRQVNHV